MRHMRQMRKAKHGRARQNNFQKHRHNNSKQQTATEMWDIKGSQDLCNKVEKKKTPHFLK